MVGWHRNSMDKSEQASGDGDGQKPGVLQSMGSPRVRHDPANV